MLFESFHNIFSLVSLLAPTTYLITSFLLVEVLIKYIVSQAFDSPCINRKNPTNYSYLPDFLGLELQCLLKLSKRLRT